MCVRNALHDIESRADCERLVRAFYGRALEDPIIGFIIVDGAKLDLEAHVPKIASFWATAKHRAIPRPLRAERSARRPRPTVIASV